MSALESELKDYRDNSHLTSALEKVHEVHLVTVCIGKISLKQTKICSKKIKI